MEKAIIKETTRFFKKHREMQAFIESMNAKPGYIVLGYGKNGNSYYVKYISKEV